MRRYEDSQDSTKLTALPNTTYQKLRNTTEYLTEQQKQIQSVNDKLRIDIINYNNWLTKSIELKTELKTATPDVIKIVSEFTFLFWLDNFEHNNDKRVQFGEPFYEEIENLCDDLKDIWNSENYYQYFESTLKESSDSLNYMEGLKNYVQIMDQGQAGSSSFTLSRSLTSTSTPKDVQVNTSLQSKQKSTIKPDKPLTSNLFGHQNDIAVELYISDSEEKEKELKFGNWQPLSVNQKVRMKTQYPIQHNYNRNKTYISSLNDNRENQDFYWEQKMYNYIELKDEITEKVTNQTNKLIDNIENKFRQTNENIERKQDEALEMMFNRLERTINDINSQHNPQTENRNTENNDIQNKREQENRTRKTHSIRT